MDFDQCQSCSVAQPCAGTARAKMYLRWGENMLDLPWTVHSRLLEHMSDPAHVQQ